MAANGQDGAVVMLDERGLKAGDISDPLHHVDPGLASDLIDERVVFQEHVPDAEVSF